MQAWRIIEFMVHKEEIRQQFASRLHAALDAISIPKHGRGVWLSKKGEVSPKAANKWLNGKSMPEQWRIKWLAGHLRVSPMWLHFGEEGRPAPDAQAEWAGGMDAWDSNSGPDPDTVDLPFFREVELSAGSGQTQVIENHGPRLKFARKSLRSAGVPEESAACVRVTGNSMEPDLPDGSTVGIDASSTQIKDGDTYAVDHDGMLRVKRLYRLPGGGIRISSFNKLEHPDEEYGPEQTEVVRVIGRVFWSAKFWR